MEYETFTIPSGTLEPLGLRELPDPPGNWKKLLGPSVIMVALSLGSGELVLWPSLTSQYGLGMIWAALLGISTQYFINMEIERWALATGESVLTGFARITRIAPWFFLSATIIPFMWPGWAAGAAEILTWLIGGNAVHYAVGSLFLVGLVLTLGPVLYNTVERIQTTLMVVAVPGIFGLTLLLVRGSDYQALARGAVGLGDGFFGLPQGLDLVGFLGALAYAGAGGAINLVQSLWIRDKGYGMGCYIGRITSPITGAEEAIPSTGATFPLTSNNLARWRGWWRAANFEHAVTFWGIGGITLVFLSLLAYATIYKNGLQFAGDLSFVLQEADYLGSLFGSLVRVFFLVMGIFILFSTELGVIDAVSRLVTEILCVDLLPQSRQSRIYYLVMWTMILLGTVILLSGMNQPLPLLILGAALNAGVMFAYSGLLLYMNRTRLPQTIGPSPLRQAMLVWALLFFGFFTIVTILNQF